MAGIGEIVAAARAARAATLSPLACRDDDALRAAPGRERVGDHESLRPPFFRDADRILHSLAYARYVDKTQVFALFENDHITHRALHVQFVSKIGRTVGRALGLNEDLIEAIALGHDIGHAPFGHDGEHILDALCREEGIGCFAHNAQSVRFLHELERRGAGLNLSLQVLDGILCHNGEMLEPRYAPGPPKSWDVFLAGYRACLAEPDASRRLVASTLEGCVARIADVIAYVGRDVEDAIRVRLLRREELPAHVTAVLGETNDRIIDTLVTDLITRSHGQPALEFSPPVFHALFALKDFNFQRIYSDDRIKTEHAKIQRMFRLLYRLYLDEFDRPGDVSPAFRKYLDGMDPAYGRDTDRRRIVIDYLAGMTDDFLCNQFRSLYVPDGFGYGFKSV